MKKLIGLLFLITIFSASLSFAQITTIWQKSIATSNLPTWFNTVNYQRNFGYGVVGGNSRLYVAYSGKTLSPILILNAATGDSVGTLDTTGISGGIFPLDDIGVSSDGIIFAGDLTTNAETAPFKVYEWKSESASPAPLISYSDSAYRLGDHFTVTGSSADNSLTIWAAASGENAVVKFTTTDHGATFTANVIALTDNQTTGTNPKVVPTDKGFIISSDLVGVREYDGSGNFLGAIASAPGTAGNVAYISGGSPKKAYVYVYDYQSQYVDEYDVSGGINAATLVASSPTLGSAANPNGTGDIQLKDNGDGTVTLYLLGTNAGVGAYNIPVWSVPFGIQTLWQMSSATNNVPAWFNTVNAMRNFAYGVVGAKDQLYLTYGGKVLTPPLILDASTGDSVGTLDTTGISGGTFPLNGIGVSTEGIIFGSDLTTNAQATSFVVYEWTSDNAKPAKAISFADSAYRLGDHITVTGSTADNSITIWAAANGKNDVVKFTTTDHGTTFTPTVIPLSDAVTTGTMPKVWPAAGGDFFVSSTSTGIREYDANGNLVGAVAAMPTSIGSMAYFGGVSPNKAYVVGYDYSYANGGNPPQYAEVVDVTSGDSSADSVNVTPVLGTTLNANGTGDIAVKNNGDGTATIFVLATNNGIGAYSFDGELTGIRTKGNETIPSSYTLSQNYPNPFNPTTQINYSVPKSGYVSIKVYNILGQEVADLFSGNRMEGNYTIRFDGSRFASGVYFYRLNAGGISVVRKMMLLK